MDLDGGHCLGGNGPAAIDTGRIAEIGPLSRIPNRLATAMKLVRLRTARPPTPSNQRLVSMCKQIGDLRLSP